MAKNKTTDDRRQKNLTGHASLVGLSTRTD